MIASIWHTTSASSVPGQAANILFFWLEKQLAQSAISWVNDVLKQLSKDPSETVLFARFSAAPRYVGKADLALTAADLQAAQGVRPSWTPHHWSADQATRALLVLSFPSEDADRYGLAIEKLFAAADVAEQVALYQALPLYPHPERFVARGVDGLRTNITAVFNAIALNNPFPADYFNEAAWNQMVLKALFVNSPLSQIQGLDSRANAKLAVMLSDYAHERWAAGRPVNPQLWRPLGPFAEGSLLADLERVLQSPERYEQQAAALACASAKHPAAQALLNTVPELQQQVMTGQLTWQNFSQNHP